MVDQVAQAISDSFFDQARGDAIAAELRAKAVAGDFDHLVDPNALAGALTETLKAHDRHFVVMPPAAAGPVPQSSSAPGPVTVQQASVRDDYGFRGAEILPGGIGLMTITRVADFDATDPDAPARRRAAAALEMLEGAEAVIIDLRGNPGGEPVMVGYLASAFLPTGMDAYSTFHTRAGTESEAPLLPHPAPRTDIPVYVLINARTGSAAEALAYTLQAAGRARVVGETSYGAANPGDLRATPSGYSVFVADGTPVNPITGTNWEAVGVNPDHPAASDDALRVAHALALADIEPGLEGERKADAALLREALTAAPARVEDAAYAGRYGRVSVSVRDGVLIVSRDGQPDLTFRPLGAADHFYGDPDYRRRAVFQRDAAGRITGLDLIIGQRPPVSLPREG